MTLNRRWICGLLLGWCLLSGLLPGTLWAHGDEDHSHGDAQPVPAALAAQPLRLEAASELFELVAVLQGNQLIIHLDRFASNEPVSGASIAVEGGPLKAAAAVEQGGVYSVPAASLSAVLGTPGSHPLVFTVQAGDSNDLLTADLVVPGPATAAAQADALPWGGRRLAALAALVLVLILGAGVFAWRRRRAAQAGAFQ